MKSLRTIHHLLLTRWVPPALLLAALWYGIAIYLRTVRQVPFPRPDEVLTGAFRLLAGDELLLDRALTTHIGASFRRWFSGYAIGAGAGLGLGLLIVLLPRTKSAVMPLVSLIHLVPGLAWIPIAILIAGLGNGTAVMLLALTTMPPVAISLADGMAAVPRDFLLVSRMCGDRPWRRFLRVQLPAALPHLLTGLRLGLANSWRVVVAAEMVIGTGTGLGYSIIQSRWTLDYTAAFVCIGGIVVFGLLADYGLFGLLERLTIRRWGMTN